MRVLLITLLILSGQFIHAQDSMFDICPIKVGEDLPAATVVDENDKEVTLSEIAAEKPTVLIFYRGAWCGYCIQHLSELNDIKAEVEALGFQMLGITLDQSSKLEESSTKSESEIPVYSDATAAATKAFGLDWQVGEELFTKYKNEYKLDLEEWSGQVHHTLPVPAIFVVRDGKIEFQYVNPNYRLRLKPETLLAVLKTL